MEHAITQSIDVFDRKVQILERAGFFADVRRKREALDKLLPTIRVTEDRLLRDLYISRTAEVAGVSREMLERELATPSKAGVARPTIEGDRSGTAADGPRARRGDRRLDRVAKGVRAERELVRMLLHQRQFVEGVGEQIGGDAFIDPTYQRLFTELVTRGPDVSVEELAAAVDLETAEILQQLLGELAGSIGPKKPSPAA